MSDLRTLFVSFDSGADLSLEQFALATDDGLETAVILSLFTDARAGGDDSLPAGTTDRRGWWGDAFPAVHGDRFGSRLWLLRREKQLQPVLNRAREYAEESLAWLLGDGLAKSVSVEASIPRDGVLGLAVAVVKPDGATSRFRYESIWKRT